MSSCFRCPNLYSMKKFALFAQSHGQIKSEKQQPTRQGKKLDKQSVNKCESEQNKYERFGGKLNDHSRLYAQIFKQNICVCFRFGERIQANRKTRRRTIDGANC